MERKVIKIVDVDGTPISGKNKQGKPYQILKFRIEDEEHNDVLEVTAFNSAFFPLLKPEATLDCDIETKPSGNFTNRIITQIYIDGKPMAEKKAFVGGGYRQSPEARLSIETQVAVKAVVDLAVAGKLPDEWQHVLNLALLWCNIRLADGTPHSTTDVMPKFAPVATPQPDKPVTSSPAPKPVETPTSDEVIPQNIGELYTAVRNHVPKEQRKALNAKDYIASFKPEIDLTDIPKAWHEIKARANWK